MSVNFPLPWEVRAISQHLRPPSVIPARAGDRVGGTGALPLTWVLPRPHGITASAFGDDAADWTSGLLALAEVMSVPHLF